MSRSEKSDVWDGVSSILSFNTAEELSEEESNAPDVIIQIS